MKNKKRNLVLVAIFTIAGILCIASGTTYAIFNYYKKGTVENTATTGKITFRYDETGVKGIDLQNAVPMLDADGIKQDEEGQYFDFTVSTKGTDQEIYYDIELEKLTDSTLDESAVKVYLTQLETVNGKIEEELEVNSIDNENGEIKKFSDLLTSSETNNKIIGYGGFDEKSGEQTITYRLRIWVDKNTDFSPEKNEDGTYKEDADGNYIYPMNNKTFKIRVNVKATTHVERGMGGLMVADCSQKECYPYSTVTLPDNSKWTVIKYYSKDSGDTTVTLLSDKYIDANGDYQDEPVLSTPGELSISEINNKIEKFLSKIKTTLSDETITATLPSAELIGITNFDNDYKDTYFHYNILGSNKPYVLSNQYYNTFWWVNKYELSPQYSVEYQGNTYRVDGFVRPVITISPSYLPAE